MRVIWFFVIWVRKYDLNYFSRMNNDFRMSLSFYLKLICCSIIKKKQMYKKKRLRLDSEQKLTSNVSFNYSNYLKFIDFNC